MDQQISKLSELIFNLCHLHVVWNQVFRKTLKTIYITDEDDMKIFAWYGNACKYMQNTQYIWYQLIDFNNVGFKLASGKLSG